MTGHYKTFLALALTLIVDNLYLLFCHMTSELHLHFELLSMSISSMAKWQDEVCLLVWCIWSMIPTYADLWYILQSVTLLVVLVTDYHAYAR